MNKHDEIKKLIAEIERYDTPSVTNVVASYPLREKLCMGIYSPWTQHWSSNNDLHCHFPELGSRAGFVVTYVIGMQEPGFNRLSYADLFDAIAASPKPAYIVLQQDFPDEEIKKRCGPTGGMLCTAFKKLGAAGLITDGPVRDIEEIRPMKFQYMSNGVAPGHGVVCVRAVNVPVRVCGIDFAPGEIVHTDINGAVKFPADKLEEVANRLKIIADYEKKRADMVNAAEPTAEAVKKAFFKEIDGIK